MPAHLFHQRIHQIPPAYLRIIEPRPKIQLFPQLCLLILAIIKITIYPSGYNSLGNTKNNNPTLNRHPEPLPRVVALSLSKGCRRAVKGRLN